LDSKIPSPVSAGVFTVDPQGAVRFQFKPNQKVEAADKFAISLENKGGVEKPTQVVLIGN
jgi:anti-sigma-K factor RskA